MDADGRRFILSLKPERNGSQRFLAFDTGGGSVSDQIAATQSNFVRLVACGKTNFGVRVYSICANLRPSAVEILVQNARRRVIVLRIPLAARPP